MSSASNTTARQPVLASVDLCVPESGQRGRVFLPLDLLKTISEEEMASHLGRCFVEEDDEARLSLLKKVIARGHIIVETYPGETSPVEMHAYVRWPEDSASRIFACVMGNMAVVERMLSIPPHIVSETATFQAVEHDYSPATITAGLISWVNRVWPGTEIPRIKLEDWAEIEVAKLWQQDLSSPCPRIQLSSEPALGARNDLGTPDSAMREAPPLQ
jgi:hypothetical protein